MDNGIFCLAQAHNLGQLVYVSCQIVSLWSRYSYTMGLATVVASATPSKSEAVMAVCDRTLIDYSWPSHTHHACHDRWWPWVVMCTCALHGNGNQKDLQPDQTWVVGNITHIYISYTQTHIQKCLPAIWTVYENSCVLLLYANVMTECHWGGRKEEGW